VAPLPVITDIFRCAFRWHHSDLGTDAVNVMHFLGPDGDAADLGSKLDDNVNNVLWNCQDSHAKILAVDITPLDGTSATYSFATGGTSKWTGFSSSHDVIPQGCNIIKMQTAKRGRSYRGRVYLPWVAETFSTNGSLDLTTVNNVSAAWNTFHTDMGADGYALRVASYIHATTEAITLLTCEQTLATQRRRLHRSSV